MSAASNRNSDAIGVIDIFAGPGGLGEGFSSLETRFGSGIHPFELAVSAEMEASAHDTLRLRAFYRLLCHREGTPPPEYFEYLSRVAKDDAPCPPDHFGDGKWKSLWEEASREALNLTLGLDEHNRVLFERIDKVKDRYKEIILIGGPPCQAYSLVGRSRQSKDRSFRTKGSAKHFLYKQYLGILAEYSPAIFIMENVKGILTSRVGKNEMFDAIVRDLHDPAAALAGSASSSDRSKRYVLLPIHVDAASGQERTAERVAGNPGEFIIRCENHGIAQARHRVIIMGVREDLVGPRVAKVPGLDTQGTRESIEKALAGLPKLRSGLSRQPDGPDQWMKAVAEERDRVVRALRGHRSTITSELKALVPDHKLPRRSISYTKETSSLAKWLRHPAQDVVLNHETRSHMPSDLGRYLFCAAFAKAHERSPSSEDFPMELAPDHVNWASGDFADRFRVQMKGHPSNTVTSHLSKDGHAFIHWDATQCRSLTVREAARLQSFPDDYLFLGNRTQQYVQVGNAVPPLIARQIAKVVWSILKLA